MIRILRIFYFGLMVGLLAVPGWTGPQSSVPSSGPSGNLALKYVPLRDALPQLSKQTGIHFQVPEELQEELIPLQEGGATGSYSMDWLKDYSHIEIVDEQTGKRKIILMRSRTSHSPEISNRLEGRKTFQANKPVQSEPPPTLSREKLLKLVEGPYRNPIPTELYQDEEYRAFFSELGVRSPRGLKNRIKAKKIRREARKLLSKMEPH
jgi:hypothetical protein